MRVAAFALMCLLAAASAAGQEVRAGSENPLAALNDQLRRVLAAAGVPFTPQQERAIALMMEERRRASEELFGNLMDFRGGPTRGEDEERLRSAIEWMRSAFLADLTAFLSPEQAAVWSAFLDTGVDLLGESDGSAADPPDQTQHVRINSNAFTAEVSGFSGGGQRTDVIRRGGVGGWHGTVQFLLKDDALNARNTFAAEQPPYQERRLGVEVSGPAVPRRLTTSLSVTQNEAKNVNAVRATLPGGVFSEGITRPNVFRQASSRSTLQIAEAHSLGIFARYAGETGRNQGVGGFTLPERASTSRWTGLNAQVSHFSVLPGTSLLEAELSVTTRDAETIPSVDATRINVLDAFNGGGAQNHSEDSSRTYDFETMYTRPGDAVTLKIGSEGTVRRRVSHSTANFGGTYTFSSLDAFVAGQPVNYRVNSGDPLLRVDQTELSFFAQTDVVLSRRLTLMVGARYDWQTNLSDANNLAPRVGIAYAPGGRTVIRGGGGLFYSGLGSGLVETQRRLDGTRQTETVIDNPSYPDPFAAGTVRQSMRSVRVTDPGLVSPYLAIGMASLERTLLTNLLLTVSYDVQREYHRLRTRDLNAPFDSTAPTLRSCRAETPAEACVRPDPSRGNVMNLESTGKEVRHNLQITVRQRFGMLNVSGSYELQRAWGNVQGGPGTAASDSYDPDADWGRAPFPLHSGRATVNARLPLGVFLTGVVRANSGRHYTITTGRDDNRDTNLTDRPPGVPPNSERGPRYVNFDLNISKAFFLGGSSGTNVNVFANMTNALNRVHYGTPSGVMTSPNFGRSTSAQDPREIEAGIRFQF